MAPTFRVRSKYYSLTFPQCDLAREDILASLREDLPAFKAVVAQEKHQDGSYHLHLYLVFDEIFDCKNERRFDVRSPGGTVFHPNVQKTQNREAWKNYCLKEDSEAIDEISGNEKLSWGECLKKAKNAVEYLAMVQEHHPRDHALHYNQLVSYAAVMLPLPTPSYDPIGITSFKDVPPAAMSWVETELVGRFTPPAHAGSGKETLF